MPKRLTGDRVARLPWDLSLGRWQLSAGSASVEAPGPLARVRACRYRQTPIDSADRSEQFAFTHALSTRVIAGAEKRQQQPVDIRHVARNEPL